MGNNINNLTNGSLSCISYQIKNICYLHLVSSKRKPKHCLGSQSTTKSGSTPTNAVSVGAKKHATVLPWYKTWVCDRHENIANNIVGYHS